jgi:heptaprenyl diphosphate synthase
MNSARRVTGQGLLASLALILYVLESVAPRPLPWMKLGLGNVAVLLALLVFGAASAAAVCLVKLGIGGLLSGGFAGPAFAIGAGAGIGSLAAMAIVHRLTPGLFSPVGLSILGAVVHQLCQLSLAFVYVRHAGLFALLPIFIATGLLSGSLTGLLAYWALDKLRALGWHELRGEARAGGAR